MAEVRSGDTVKVHYTGRLDDGTVFDTSREGDPIEFTVGQGEVISGFEDAVVGMNPGETKTATVPSDEAYGPYRDEMVIEVAREEFPDNFDAEVGQQLQIRQPDGDVVVVTITDVSDDSLTLDANHPLAGEDLTFDINLVQIV